MSTPNLYKISSYALFGIIGLALIVLAFVQMDAKKYIDNSSTAPELFKKFAITEIKYPSKAPKFLVDYVLPGTPLKWLMLVLFIILCVVPVALLITGVEKGDSGNKISNNDTSVPVPTTSASNSLRESFGNSVNMGSDTYKSIGYGPLIDKDKVTNWVNGSLPSSGFDLNRGKTSWPDGNGKDIQISSTDLKSLYGFIPPSIMYFPSGAESNDYNAKNYQKGRENCMTACSISNCTAVQTEVPQNCSQQQISAGIDSCGKNSAFSCTLFYDSIEKADDGYWLIEDYSNSSGNTGGCFDTDKDECLSIKYYEDLPIPTRLPNNTLPSESTVKFCDATVTKPEKAGYASIPGGPKCSCTGPSCTDSNCCVIRNITTTEFMQKKHPYYALPIKVFEAQNAVGASTGAVSGSYSMIVPANNVDGEGKKTPCGLVKDEIKCLEYGYKPVLGFWGYSWEVDTSVCKTPNPHFGKFMEISSCSPSPCQAPGDVNCWEVLEYESAPGGSTVRFCNGSQYEPPSEGYAITDPLHILGRNPNAAQKALEAYKTNGAGDNYQDLDTACYYRKMMAQVTPIQFQCSPDTITRGCASAPPIIFTSNLSGNYGACSSNFIIPQSARCQEQDPSKLSECTGFPYSCGTNDGTSNLWTRI